MNSEKVVFRAMPLNPTVFPFPCGATVPWDEAVRVYENAYVKVYGQRHNLRELGEFALLTLQTFIKLRDGIHPETNETIQKPTSQQKHTPPNIPCIATVLIGDKEIDSQGDRIDIEGVSIPARVRLTRNFGKSTMDLLGYADLRREGDKIIAEFMLPTSELPPFPIFAYVGGAITERERLGEHDAIIRKCSVDEIALGTSPNSDKRIGPIKRRDEDGPASTADSESTGAKNSVG